MGTGINFGNPLNNFQLKSYEKVIADFNELNIDKSNFMLEDKTRNWDAIKDAIKDCDDTALSYFKTLENGNGNIKNASASTRGFSQYLKETGKALDFATIKATALDMALNAGIILAVTLAVKVLATAWDKVNVTVAEQQEKLDGIKSRYQELQSEYDIT